MKPEVPVRRAAILLGLLAACLPCAGQEVGEKERAEGFARLFNGKDLAGWKQYAGKPGLWSAEDGMLVCRGGGGGWLGTEREHADFELRLEYRLRPGGNSGV